MLKDLLFMGVASACGFCGPLVLALQAIVVVGAAWVTWNYFTKNKLVVLLVAAIAAYAMFM